MRNIASRNTAIPTEAPIMNHLDWTNLAVLTYRSIRSCLDLSIAISLSVSLLFTVPSVRDARSVHSEPAGRISILPGPAA